MKTVQVRPELVAKSYLPESLSGERCADIDHLVEPSFRFEESARFYGHLFGCSPQMNEELGTCTFERAPLSLFRVGEPLSSLSSMLELTMAEDAFRKAVGWCSRVPGRILERGEGWILIKDPDGRLLRVKKA